MEHELKDAVNTYMGKYGKTLEQKLGLTRDDLINDIREQVWKGLITHNPSGTANVKTYLNTLIKNRFLVLFKRSKIRKNNMIQYFSDVFGSNVVDEEHTVTEETSESFLMHRQAIMEHQFSLKSDDRMIYEDLINGRNLNEMTAMRGIPRYKVVAAINRVIEILNKGKK